MDLPKIISVDDHVVEPPHVWQTWLPQKYREKGPRIERNKWGAFVHKSGARYINTVDEENGIPGDAWIYEDRVIYVHKRFVAIPLEATPGGDISKFDRETMEMTPITYDEMRPGCYDRDARVAEFEANWMDGSLPFPTFPRFCGQTFMEGDDKELGLACVEAYNNWMIEEWCEPSGGMNIPLCIIPMWDPELAAAEVRRIAAKGAHAICFSELPVRLKLPSIHSGHWDPLFAACNENQVTICMHVGSSSTNPAASPDAPPAAHGTLAFNNSMASMSDWLFSGKLIEFPDLKLAYSEGQIGWIPYALERADEVWDRHNAWMHTKEKIPDPPSTYYWGRIYGCFTADHVGLANIELCGVENVCFETDYPHTDTSWPHSKAYAEKVTAHLSPEQAYKVLRGNAITMLSLDRVWGGAVQLDDMILVSVDDHVVEPPDMFDDHLPERWKDKAPRVVTKDDGSDVWLYEGNELPNIGLNAVSGRPPEEYGIDPTSFEHMRTGCYDIDARVDDMNANGVLGSMCFPSFPQFCGQLFARTDDKEQALAMLRAYNDWHIDEWCGTHPGRFIPLALPALWDPQLAADEVRRVAAKGCRAVTFSENPEKLGYPSFHNEHWDPFFAACEDEGVVLCLHIGSSSQLVITSVEAPINVMITLQPMNIVQAAADVLWSRVLQQFPRLRVALSEGGIGWIPYFLERVDYVYQHHKLWTGHDLGMLPSELFRERFVTCFIDDAFGLESRRHLNMDMVTWECDYPHSDSTWPHSPESLWKALQAAEMTDDEIHAITHRNALRLFSYDPFSVRPAEQCTVGALRAEAAGVDTSIVSHGAPPPPEQPIRIIDLAERAMGKKPSS